MGGLIRPLFAPLFCPPYVEKGNYYGAAPFLISPTAGLAGLPGVNATYAMGCEIDGTSTADFAAAEALARASDYTVIVIGLNEVGAGRYRVCQGKEQEMGVGGTG